jgi:dihydrofolate reductase
MINALLATDQWGGMGFRGTLPWHIPEDLKHFQTLTMGQHLVMGRKTWDDPKFPKPLPGRFCHVVTSKPETLELSAHAVDSKNIKQAVLDLESRFNKKDIFIIGGPKLIMECHDILDYIYLTRVSGNYSTDVKINLKQLLVGFSPVSSSHSPGSKATFIRYEHLFKRPTGSA